MHGNLSMILKESGLERFQYLMETKLKVVSISQLFRNRNLGKELIGIGMNERQVDEFRRILELNCRPQRLEFAHQKPTMFASISLPTSPCESGPQLNGPDPTSPGLHNGWTHSPRCSCETCCNRRNEEYMVWFREDDVNKKKCQPLTRQSEKETADDVRKALEIIYTKNPNKFAIPQGRALDLRDIATSRYMFDEQTHKSDNSPTTSDSEITPPKTGFKINLPWKQKQSIPNQRSTRKPSLLLKQRFQEDKSKVGSSIPAVGSFSPFTKIQEALEKRKNKLSLRINVPTDEEACKDLNIKPMSANAEKKMRETLGELAKLRNNNSPKSPTLKQSKTSPTNQKGGTSFKFPHTKNTSLPSSQEKAKDDSGDKSPKISQSSIMNKGSSTFNDLTSQVKVEGRSTKVNFNRLSSVSSSSSHKSLKCDRNARGCLKMRSRMSRRTTSECSSRPRTGSFGCAFTPYLNVKSLSVELKDQRKTSSSSCDYNAVFSQLQGNPLLKSRRLKSKKCFSANDAHATEFIIKFNSSLTLHNKSNTTFNGTDVHHHHHHNTSNGTLKKEIKTFIESPGKMNRFSPPPAIPPRAPIKHKTCTPSLSIRESINKKRSYPLMNFPQNISSPQIELKTDSSTLNRGSSRERFSKSEKNDFNHRSVIDFNHPAVIDFNHPAVMGPSKLKHQPKVFISGSTATYKSYDHIPRQQYKIPSYPADHRFSADASTYTLRMRANIPIGEIHSRHERSEDDSTISNSSSECKLDESTSYEDIMEQALDSSAKTSEEEDVAFFVESRKKDYRKDTHLEDCHWMIPESKKRPLDGKDKPLLSPCSGKTILCGQF